MNFSCKKEEEGWDTELLIPLVNSNLSVKNLVDDSLVYKKTDNSIGLVYTYYFDKIRIGDWIKIPDTTIVRTFTLETIKIGKREIYQDITLGMIARQSGGPIGQIILQSHGSMLPIPPIANTALGTTEIDATSLFETIEVQDGVLITTITNGLPIDLTDVILSLKNKSSGTLILLDTIQVIKSHKTYMDSVSLDGKSFEGLLTAEVLNISSPGTTTPVKIDTNNAINVKMMIDIKSVSSAKAIFPSQNLVDLNTDVEYDLNGLELTYMEIKSGKFKIIVASTLQDSSYITYSIPGAKHFGITPLYFETTLPPAKDGDTVYVERTFDVDDFWYDLRGKDGTKTNAFTNIMQMRIDSTGKMVDLSLDDSIYLFYSLYDVIPGYLRGFIGQDSFSYSGSLSDISIFKNLKGGGFDLKDVNLNFFVQNGFGAEADIKVNKIEAKNNKLKTTIELNSSVLNSPFKIDKAKDNPLTATYSKLNLNGSNSNAPALINMMPDEFAYDVAIRLNPNGNNGQYSDFLYDYSTIGAGLEIELPLDLTLSKLYLEDTLDVDFSNTTVFDQINRAKLKVLVENNFPIQTEMQVYMLDQFKEVIDSFFLKPVVINEGEVGVNGKVLSKKTTELSVDFSKHQIDMLKSSNYFIIKAIMDTNPQSGYLKIYSDYQINLKIVADLGYTSKL